MGSKADGPVETIIEGVETGIRKTARTWRKKQSDAASKIKKDLEAVKGVDDISTVPSPARKQRKKSRRNQFLGRTPGKSSRTGREVQERMRSEGTLRDNPRTGRPEVLDTRTNPPKWISTDKCDMGHNPRDAVEYWNTDGYKHGPKSPEVRQWMLDPNNYRLEPAAGPGGNRSLGAKLGLKYRDPLIP